MKDELEPKQQPRVIYHRGVRFQLVSRWKRVKPDEPITEGPFYGRPGVDHKEWAYTPDAAYLGGQSKTVSTMHCIQQVPAPATPNPGSVM